MPKDYLGDMTFAEVENGRIKVIKLNEVRPADIVYLEPETYHRLVAFVESIQVIPQTNETISKVDANQSH